ncbi:YqzL-like protein [Caminicella sporogenes DSM 14501]|uniref:YqzL-like protein n=1 Tax=Caminicella sporogenes DSM 14501 TaxID=1121266 RepID=A0A1M6MBD4_9FIRM|nr:YqzL family protein [Caminicella sporogenes]WIF94790.1 YqzL family protein [Caminicella sporogenes]SHJ80680.1 YqzL-like protein [Caminicella sporogenes DSM 14501]
MERETLWKLFSKTGDINTYLLLKEYEQLINDIKTNNIHNMNDEDFQNINLR